MTEKSAEDFIPGVDDLDEPPKSLINFNINDQRIAAAKEEFKDVDAYKDLGAAKKAKQVLTKMRTTLGEAHKDQKAEALAHGRMLDTEKRRLLELIAEIEDPIKKDLDDIKNAEAIKEEKRLENIQGNIDQIRSHGQELDGLSISALQSRQESLALHQITEDIYQEHQESAQGAYYEAESRLRLAISKRQEFEEEEARLETQRKEQEKRQADMDKQQAEIDERNRKDREEQEDRDRVAREEQEAKDKERQAELDKQAEEQRNAQQKIDDENDRLAKEKSDKDEAERKEQAARDEAARKQRLAPDHDKLLMLATALEEMPLPQCESDEAHRVLLLVVEKCKPIVEYIRNEARKMK